MHVHDGLAKRLHNFLIHVFFFTLSSNFRKQSDQVENGNKKNEPHIVLRKDWGKSSAVGSQLFSIFINKERAAEKA